MVKDGAFRFVEGTATTEDLDSAGEIMDYEAVKACLPKYMAERATLRAMHQPIAAGLVVEATADDATRSIRIVSKVVDPIEVMKVDEGIYKGYSIRGDCEKMARRLFMRLWKETSLVDWGCNPKTNDLTLCAAKLDLDVPRPDVMGILTEISTKLDNLTPKEAVMSDQKKAEEAATAASSAPASSAAPAAEACKVCAAVKAALDKHKALIGKEAMDDIQACYKADAPASAAASSAPAGSASDAPASAAGSASDASKVDGMTAQELKVLLDKAKADLVDAQKKLDSTPKDTKGGPLDLAQVVKDKGIVEAPRPTGETATFDVEKALDAASKGDAKALAAGILSGQAGRSGIVTR